MVLYGTIINGITIIIGSMLGFFLSNIPERYKQTIVQGVSLVVIIIGLQMALTAEEIIIVLLSLLLGAIVGEGMRLEDRLNDLTKKATRFMSKKNGDDIATGFISASLLFAVGAMAIIGALDSGIRLDHELLVTKAILDGFTALILTTTLG